MGFVDVRRMIGRGVRLWVCAAAVAGAGPGVAGASPLSWGHCRAGSDAALAGFRCARLRVPLDYGRPHGRLIALALVRHPASRRSARAGTLFVNPGGPGGLGTVQIPDWFLLFPKAVRERFDVVSWDPRGVGQSTAVQCFANQDAENAFLGDAAEFPVGAEQKATYVATWDEVGRRCAQRNGSLLSYVSTADTARDLDRLRRASGEPTMTYWGLSYGTILGATYANLFPSRVRAVVLDGNIAPSAWTATDRLGPSFDISLRIGSNVGAATDLRALLSLCGRASVTACPFSAGSPSATRAKFDTLLERLAARRVVLQGTTITYAGLLGDVANTLDVSEPFQDPRLPASAGSTGWAGIAAALEQLWQLSDQPTAPARPQSARSEGQQPYAGPEQGLAVECGDTPNPRDPQRYDALESFVLGRAGPIGLPDLWMDEACSTWPARASDNYRGPWNRRTAHPVLVVGNTGDPATPYSNAVGMTAQLSRARLLTVKGWGHTTALNPSACANRHITAYLLHRTLPPPGTVCHQNRVPFSRRGEK
jgi:pimeloyl-ACP methyl ester carboxylesterase